MGTHELPPPTYAHRRTCSFVRDLLAASSVLQAYLLGAATSELALMQQASRERRVRLEAVKQHLRYLRVPPFLKDQILEYYDMVVIRKQMQEVDVLSSMPSSLKVLPQNATSRQLTIAPYLLPPALLQAASCYTHSSHPARGWCFPPPPSIDRQTDR